MYASGYVKKVDILFSTTARRGSLAKLLLIPKAESDTEGSFSSEPEQDQNSSSHLLGMFWAVYPAKGNL